MTDYPKGEKYYKEVHRILGFNYDKLKVERNELLEALEGLYKSVVREVELQGRGYSESNLLCLPEFKNAQEAIAKARGEA